MSRRESPEDIHARMAIVERDVGQVVDAVKGLAGALDEFRKEIVKNHADFSNRIAEQPRPFPIREVAAAVVFTLTVSSALVATANWWLTAQTAPVFQRVEDIRSVLEAADLSVLKYRIGEIEKYIGEHKPPHTLPQD